MQICGRLPKISTLHALKGRLVSNVRYKYACWATVSKVAAATGRWWLMSIVAIISEDENYSIHHRQKRRSPRTRAALAFTTLNRPLAGESESLATSLSGGDGGDEDDGGGGGGTCVAASLATDVASAATAASATKLSKYTII